jgi:hypothetical protein
MSEEFKLMGLKGTAVCKSKFCPKSTNLLKLYRELYNID